MHSKKARKPKTKPAPQPSAESAPQPRDKRTKPVKPAPEPGVRPSHQLSLFECLFKDVKREAAAAYDSQSAPQPIIDLTSCDLKSPDILNHLIGQFASEALACSLGQRPCPGHAVTGGCCPKQDNDQDIRPEGDPMETGEEPDSQELVSNLPQDDSDEGASPQEPTGTLPVTQADPAWLPYSPGAPPRWDDSPSLARPSRSSTSNKKSEVLRFRLLETWQLSNGEESVRCLQLSHEGGSDPTHVWSSTGPEFRSGEIADLWQAQENRGWWKPEAIYGLESCLRFTIWSLDKVNPLRQPWILLTAKTTDRGIRILVCRPQSQKLKTPVETLRLQGDGLLHQGDCRVVELEYQVHQIFPTAPALRQWCKANLQDDTDSFVEEVLDDLRYPQGRGLLRSVRGWSLRLGIHGRVQGKQIPSILERMVARGGHEFKTEGQTTVQDGQHSDDDTVELHSSGSVQKRPLERSQQVGPNGVPTHPNTPYRSPRHKRTCIGDGPSRLRCDEELNNSPINWDDPCTWHCDPTYKKCGFCRHCKAIPIPPA